jgi:hypothetical protein
MAFTVLTFSMTYEFTEFTTFIGFTRNCRQNCRQPAPAKSAPCPIPLRPTSRPGARTSWNVCTSLLRRPVRNILIDDGTIPSLTLAAAFLGEILGPIQALICYHGSTAWCQISTLPVLVIQFLAPVAIPVSHGRRRRVCLRTGYAIDEVPYPRGYRF